MPKYEQANRPMRVETVLGEDVLLLDGFSGEEAVSRPFLYTLDLLSESPSVDAEKMLRSPISISIKLVDGGERTIRGWVRSFIQLGRSEELTSYRAEMVPWLWFLSLSTDCRVFQDKSVVEIIEQVFDEQGYSDYEDRCSKSYPKREYCIQYRESHLDFVSRLMEEEGILYFFDHDSKDVLVLGDSSNAIKPCPSQDVARMASTPGPWQDEDVVSLLGHRHSVHTGKVTLRDYNYLKPSLSLEKNVVNGQKEESYDYPGGYQEPEDGDRYARLILEGHETKYETVYGEGTCRSFQSGYRFDLKEHYRRNVNQPYQLIQVRHHGKAGDYMSWQSAAFDYTNEFMAIPHSVPYRPPRRTTKPTVHGSQSAVVVGKSGEEIWVDKYGRVKVQFHWDREGKKDENSSCWVRVSSAWSGKGWGAIQIPRIGQEVVIDFLEGDPDRPIITGRVYNAEAMPPYALPADQTQSGIKSRSSKEGGEANFNEIRMEDKKGEEQLYIHAEKDKQVVVENDRTESVGNDETISIGNNRTEDVGKDETITIGENRTESVGKDEAISVDGNRTETVGKDERVTIKGNRDASVSKDMTTDVSGSRSLSVKKDSAVDIGKNHGLDVGKQITIKAGDSISIESNKQITIKTGSASIVMKKNGDITIKGGKIQVKASKDLILKGSKIAEN